MKKKRLLMLNLSIAAFLMVLTCVLAGCNGAVNNNDTVNDEHKYEVTVEGEYASECEIGQSYPAGEEVTVKLPFIFEHYYSLYVNGEEVQWDIDRSDTEYTYFTFIMPECDVTVKIECHSVDIPEAP